MAGAKRKRINTESRDQYRCTLMSVYNLYKSISKRITDKHRNVMRRTPFSLFFKALDEGKILLGKRSNDMLDDLINRYDKVLKKFKIGGNYYTPSRLDIKLIFGIDDGVEEVGDMSRHDAKHSEIGGRLFGGVDRLKACMVKYKTMELVLKNDDTSVEDTIKLLCLIIFQSVFFTTTGQYIPWGFLQYVDDIDMMRKYDWSSHIRKELIQGLNGNWKCPGKANGCTVVLLYWMCEHSNIIKTVFGTEGDGCEHGKNSISAKGIPRITKWDLRKLTKVLTIKKLRTMKDNEFNGNELEPTVNEHILIPSLSNVQNNHGECSNVPGPTTDSDFEDYGVGRSVKEASTKMTRQSCQRSHLKEKGKAVAETSMEVDMHDVDSEPRHDGGSNNDNVSNTDETGEMGNSSGSMRIHTNNQHESPSTGVETTSKMIPDMITHHDIQMMQFKLEQMEIENKNLTSELESLKLDQISRINKVNDLDQECRGLRLQLDKSTAEKTELELEVEALKNARNRLKDEMTMTVSKIEMLEAMVKEKDDILAEKEQRIEELDDTIIEGHVHNVTQHVGLSVQDEHANKVESPMMEVVNKPAAIGQTSMIRRLKKKGGRRPNKIDDYHYDEQKKRKKVETVDLELYPIPKESEIPGGKAVIKAEKSAYKCGKYISEDAFTMLRDANDYGGRGEDVWSKELGALEYVTVATIVNILNEGYVPETVIDAVRVLLERSNVMQQNYHIYPANTWVKITEYAKKRNYTNGFSKDLLGRIQRGEKIFFPLCCPGIKSLPYHWVLLTYSAAENSWKMYHSLAMRGVRRDPFLINCQDIEKYVLHCMYACGDKKQLKKVPECAGIVKVKNLPLQHEESTDCAFFVIHYLLKLAQGKSIPQKWTDEELQRLKGMVVTSIMLDTLPSSF